jgi:hypothetical protein
MARCAVAWLAETADHDPFVIVGFEIQFCLPPTVEFTLGTIASVVGFCDFFRHLLASTIFGGVVHRLASTIALCVSSFGSIPQTRLAFASAVSFKGSISPINERTSGGTMGSNIFHHSGDIYRFPPFGFFGGTGFASRADKRS